MPVHQPPHVSADRIIPVFYPSVPFVTGRHWLKRYIGAWVGEEEIAPGQLTVEEKSNEIRAIKGTILITYCYLLIHSPTSNRNG
jgi:hypothetical protein